MVQHDLLCSHCDKIFFDCLICPSSPGRCPSCQYPLEITYLPRHILNAACHPSETCVVYYSPKENKIQYPGRNDIPIPDRLQRRGYQRLEMRSIHDIQRFEKQHHVINERVWYDRGSGHGPEDS